MKESKATLVFSNKGVLIALCCSANQLAKFGHCHGGNISKVCLGQLETLGGYYFRYTSPLHKLTIEDIGTLSIEEYDKATNFQSKTFFTRSKARIISRWLSRYGKRNNGI